MEIDIKGKIKEKKLAFSNTLLPLFEAIVNSIQAIEEESATKPGIIEISLIRSSQKNIEFKGEATSLPDIIDFVIKDNGIGFNEQNFLSFNRAHSTYKSGGKGIGRFTWLRAFQKAEIESQFKANGVWNLRKFSFEPTIKGIEGHHLEKMDDFKERWTIVKLLGLKEEYRKWCNSKAEGIGLKIIEHAFIYFLNEDCPRIIIYDLDNTLIVNDLFKLYIKEKVKTKRLTINGKEFKLRLVKMYTPKVDNKIHYSANNREVLTDKISIDIPEFDNFLQDDEGLNFSIAVYVEGDFLDQNVNEERTNISFRKDSIEFEGELTQEELRKSVTNIIEEEFEDQIEYLSDTRFNKVKEFVGTHPRYKQLLKYKPERLKKIPSTLTEEKLEIEVFKIQQELELEVKKETNTFLKFIDSKEDMAEFEAAHKELYAKIIEVGNSKLSEYVIHRKLVLDLFDKLLKRKATEEAVHSLIFPLRTLSDEIGFEDHNLWMIDEKLAYHKYLASDLTLKKVDPIDSDSSDRLDLVIFNKSFVFSNDDKPYQSIVIVEFKRPMKNDYTAGENPIQQVLRYARKIIKGEVKDKYSREFDIRKNTPLYAYIICDLTKNLKEFATDSNFKLLPSGDGYFTFNENYNMYLEIMSFDKILNDSKDRNRVLFEKLNLT